MTIKKHIKKFGFESKNNKLDFRYKIELADDDKYMKKSMTMSRLARCKLSVYESRIWHMDMANTRRLSFSLGFLFEEKHILDYFKITDSESKDLQYLPAMDKLKFLRYYFQKTHKYSYEFDTFYSLFNKANTVLFHTLESMLIYYPRIIQRLFVPKFFHDRNKTNFLKELRFIGVYDKIDRVGFSEFPDIFGRKLYEYRKKTTNPNTVTISPADND